MPVPLKSRVDEWRENVLHSWLVQGPYRTSTLQTPSLRRPAREPAVINGELTAPSLRWLNRKCLSRTKLPFSCLFQSIFKAVAEGLKVFHTSAGLTLALISPSLLFIHDFKIKSTLLTNMKGITSIFNSGCYFQCCLWPFSSPAIARADGLALDFCQRWKKST